VFPKIVGDFMMCLVCNCSGKFSPTICREFGNFLGLRIIGKFDVFHASESIDKTRVIEGCLLYQDLGLLLCLCCFYVYISAFVCLVRIINEFVNLFHIPTKCGFADLVSTSIE